MTDAQRRTRFPLRRWIRAGFVAWAVVSTWWVVGAFRTRGIDPGLLQSHAQVSVHRSQGTLAFLPTSAHAASGLVFIVGAGVEPSAYAAMLRPIAAMGHPVFVLALPWRIAPLEAHKEATVARARAIVEGDTSADRWVIAGHSLGAALACRMAGDPPSRAKAIVLIATTHPKAANLSSAGVPITKVFATNDGVATAEAVARNRALLPRDTRWVEIEGGNHSQFGHYGRQLFDGRPTISRERQQAITRSVLVDALRY